MDAVVGQRARAARRAVRRLALALVLAAFATALAQAATVLRVGLYENTPKIGADPAGRPQGVFVDVLEAIARDEGWTIEWVPGTFAQGLERLVGGEIDLMPDVALTPTRAGQFAFHREPVLSSWFQVYARRGSGIRSLPDLDGRRVALLAGSAQQELFGQMIEGFGMRVEVLLLPSFADAFDAVARGRADAVVSNRFYGALHAREAGLEDTAVVFAPSRLFFAAAPGHAAAVHAAIDRRLTAYKADPASPYFKSLRRWTQQVEVPAAPWWLLPLVNGAGLALAAALAWTFVLRRQVAARTRELAARTDEVLVVNRTLRAATTQLDTPAILAEALRGARELTGADGGVFCLRDPARGLLRVGAALDACGDAAQAPDGGPLRDAACPAFAAALPRHGGYLVLDARSGPAPMPCANVHDASVRWNLLFPILVRGESVGVLCLFSRRDEPPAERLLQQVQELCAPLGLAMDNARLVEQSRQHARELEARVAGRTEELARANRDLHEAKEAAEAADRIKSAFLATMSHELRTPLNSIIGFTGIMLQGLAGPLNEEQHKQMEMVRGSARHLLELINDVLDISKIEAGQLEVAQAPVDLPASITKVVALARPLAAAKALALEHRVDAQVGIVQGDARRIEQILLNLLSNAVKFTEHGAVTLHARRDGAHVAIAVADTGIGIREEDMAVLFRPFRQVDSALSRQHEGTGLGLAICRRLAELMGGTIQASSRWQHGSVFTVTLPLEGKGR